MLKIKKKLNEAKKNSGFSLVEVVVAATIIAAVIASFAVFLTNVAQVENTAGTNRTASRIIAAELDKIAGARWDDLMSPPSSGSGTGCVITPSRLSLQIVQTGPTTVTSDVLPVSITRTVVWGKTLAPITNAVGNGTTVTYTAVNSFTAGQVISTYDITPRAYNLINVTVASATATQFTITNSATGTYSSGGWAGVSVYCSGVKDSQDLKVLNVTGVWNDGSITRIKSFTETASKYTFGARVK